jgi:hypothetical protein
MANTLIQIKRSSVTSLPSSLSPAEPAYSYAANTLFIGTADGAGVIPIGGYSYIQSINATSLSVIAAFDKANSANLLAYNTGIGANAFASATIAGANSAIGIGANAFASATIAGANSAIGTGANAFTSATIAGANSAVGAGANNYSNATFVKLVNNNQTITGNLAITGSLTVAGNAFSIDTETLKINDPLIYLAGNNYVSDIVDIGFVANYVNATGSNVHTGLFRDATVKEYYLFQGYDKEPEPNHIDPAGNNFTLAVLNAAIRTSNLNLGGQNTIVWITSAFDQANAANLLAYNTGIGANAFASATIAGANTAVGAGANAFASATIAGANTAVGAGANAFASATIAGANTAVGAGANAYAALVGSAANTNAADASYLSVGTVPSARISGSYTNITGVGTITTGTWNGDVISVSYGGTGKSSLTQNGILYGNTAGPVKITSAGTEGQVLQADSTGVPLFAHLDGGSF